MPSRLAEHILALKDYVESDQGFQDRNARLKNVRQHRFNEIAPRIPPEFKATATDHRSPFIFDMLRRAPGLTSTKFPAPTVVPLKSGPKAQENSSLREDWLMAAYVHMDREGNVYHRLMDALAADGCAVWKVISQEHTWAAPEKKQGEDDGDYLERVKDHKRANFPFYMEFVPTDSWYELPDENGPNEVLILTEQPAAQLAAKYNINRDDGTWKKGRGKDIPQGNEIKVEYWSKDEFAYMVGDVIVGKGKHKYGRPPFFRAMLTLTSAPDRAHEFFGLADPLIKLQDTFDSLVTIKTNWAYLNGFPYPALEPLGDNAIPIEDAKIELVHGKPFIPPPGYRLTWVVPPPTGQDMNQLMSLLKTIIDQVGLAPVLFGNMPGDTSGTAANTMIAVAKSIFGPGLDNMARAFDDMASFLQQQIEVLGDPVEVWQQRTKLDNKGKEIDISGYIALGPKDINGYYRVTHTLMPVLPAEQQVKYMYLADAQARGYVTMDYVREEGMGIHNPEQMNDECWLEKAAQTPQVNNVIMAKALAPYQEDQLAGGIGANPIAAMAARNGVAPGGVTPQANVPISPGGPGAQVAQGVNQPMGAGGPNARMATPGPGMGRG